MNYENKNDFENSDGPLGIDNLKQMISFMVSMANAVGRSLEDGDLSVWDVRHLWDPMTLAIPAFKNAKSALQEFDDMSDDEKQLIYDHIEEEFDLDYDYVESYVQKGLEAAVAFGDFLCDTMDRYLDADEAS